MYSVNTAAASIVFVEWLELIRIQMSARARSKAGLSGQLVRARFSADEVEGGTKTAACFNNKSVTFLKSLTLFQHFEGRAR